MLPTNRADGLDGVCANQALEVVCSTLFHLQMALPTPTLSEWGVDVPGLSLGNGIGIGPQLITLLIMSVS